MDDPSPLRDLRTGRGWLQEETADRLSLDRRVYSDYETGRRWLPPDLLVRIADLYQLASPRVDELVRWSADRRTALDEEREAKRTGETS